MSTDTLEAGYWRAYRECYRWGSILRGASRKSGLVGRARHVAYAGGWKKLEPLWDLIIRGRRLCRMLPVLETVLSEFGRSRPANPGLDRSGIAAMCSAPGAGLQGSERGSHRFGAG